MLTIHELYKRGFQGSFCRKAIIIAQGYIYI